MGRLNETNLAVAKETIALYPRVKSALIPILHIAQEQDGYVSTEAMAHIAELMGLTAAEVYGTASFYEMFKFEPVGRYCINVCTNISCQLVGGWELLEHAEGALGIKAGSTTPDQMFTLEDVECIAACTEAPALQVNYRYRNKVTPVQFDEMITALRAGELADEFPPHGTLSRIRQGLPENWADTGRIAQTEVDAR